MKKLLSLAVLIALLLFPGAASAASITAENWDIRAKAEQNGDLLIVEEISYRFDEDFNGVYRSISKEGTDGIRILSVEEILGETTTPYAAVTHANNEDVQRYTFEEKSDYVLLKIFAPVRSKEKKIFRITYQTENVVIKQQDTADFNYSFLGDSNEIPVETMRISLQIPGSDLTGKPRFFIGKSSESTLVSDGDRIILTMNDVPASSEVTLRVLYPLEFLSSGMRSGNLTKNSIVVEAAEREERVRRRAATIAQLTLLLPAGIALVGALTVLGLHFSRPKGDPGGPYSIDELKPAEAAHFLSTGTAACLHSTVFDLVRRRVLSVEKSDVGADAVYFYMADPTALLDTYERRILDFYFHEIGDGTRFRLSDAEKYFEEESTRSAFLRMSSKIITDLKQNLKDQGLTQSSFPVPIFALLLFVTALVSIFFAIRGSTPWLGVALAAVICSVILLAKPKRSACGKALRQYYRALRKDLKNGIFPNVDSDLALVYAIALDVEKQAKKSYDFDADDTAYWIPMYMIASSSSNYRKMYNMSSYYDDDSGSGGGGGFSGSAGGGGSGGF